MGRGWIQVGEGCWVHGGGGGRWLGAQVGGGGGVEWGGEQRDER